MYTVAYSNAVGSAKRKVWSIQVPNNFPLTTFEEAKAYTLERREPQRQGTSPCK